MHCYNVSISTNWIHDSRTESTSLYFIFKTVNPHWSMYLKYCILVHSRQPNNTSCIVFAAITRSTKHTGFHIWLRPWTWGIQMRIIVKCFWHFVRICLHNLKYYNIYICKKRDTSWYSKPEEYPDIREISYVRFSLVHLLFQKAKGNTLGKHPHWSHE